MTTKAKLRRAGSLWRCPRCGKRFVTRHLWHSCRRISVDDHLKGKSPKVRRLYRKFAAMMRKCGPVIISPSKNGIAFQVRMRFGGCVVRKDALRVGFILTRRLRSPRVVQVLKFSPRSYGHRLWVRKPRDLDSELQAWLREAYRVGTQERLLAQSRKQM